MPLVTIKMLEGRTVEQKRKIAAEVTQTIAETLDITADRVIIDFQHIATDDLAKAGKLISDL